MGALNRQSQGILVDGADFTEGMFGDMSGSVPMLAIREFEVIQSQYSAELGRAASGIINVATRRGGNDFTFDAFGLYRHKVVSALGAFETEKPDFSRSHWGAAVGGPLVVDRAHFFATYEWRTQSDFATINTRGAFPSLDGTFRTPFTDNLMVVRIDHRANDAQQLTLRYSGEVGRQLFGVGGRNTLQYGRNNTLDMHSALLTHRWSTRSTVLNETRLHFITSRRVLDRNAPSWSDAVLPKCEDRTPPVRGANDQ